MIVLLSIARFHSFSFRTVISRVGRGLLPVLNRSCAGSELPNFESLDSVQEGEGGEGEVHGCLIIWHTFRITYGLRFLFRAAAWVQYFGEAKLL